MSLAWRLIRCLSLAPMLMSSAAAAPFESATVRRIIDGKEVYVDRQQAMVNDTANRGQQVSTGSSRTELLFDQRAIGFLGQQFDHSWARVLSPFKRTGLDQWTPDQLLGQQSAGCSRYHLRTQQH